jgi:hypothetical protein
MVEGGLKRMPAKTISINRAPVLTLWATVVAERLGFNENEALSLGKALAGLTAQSKGRRLGIYKPHEEGAKQARHKERGEEFWIEVCGRPFQPRIRRRVFERCKGLNLAVVRSAMERLAKRLSPKELAEHGFGLYERFRPVIPEGVKGWGAKGELDLGLIERLAKEQG